MELANRARIDGGRMGAKAARVLPAAGGLLLGAYALRSAASLLARANGVTSKGANVQLKEFIVPNPHGIQADDTSRHAAEEMRRHGFGAIPVYDQARMVGVITDRDLTVGCVAAAHDAGTCAVREHMTADPITIDAGASIEDALAKMADAQVRRLIVTDGQGIAGIVSLGDLAVRCADSALVGRTLAQISEPVRQPLAV